MKQAILSLFFLFFISCFIFVQKTYAGDIVWCNSYSINLRGLSHQKFNSTYVGEDVCFTIYTPPGYDSGTQRYPVIYFLHGISGNEWNYVDWMQDNGGVNNTINLISTVEKGKTEPYIAVFPNGGSGSGYADYVENMIIKELIPYVDSHFRTKAERRYRAIEGFSMGGNGSAKLAFRHSDMFVSTSPMSGGEVAKYLEANASAIKQNKLAIRYVYGSNDNYGTTGYNELIPLLNSLNISYELQKVEGVGHNLFDIEQAASLKNVQFHLKAMNSGSGSPMPSSSLLPSASTGLIGDANGDGVVNIEDALDIIRNFGKVGTTALGHVNNDNKVNLIDFGIWFLHRM